MSNVSTMTLRSTTRVRLLFVAAALLLWLTPAVPANELLTLHRERESPFDLEITGRLEGVQPGESRFVRWADLRARADLRLKLTGEFVPGEQEVTALFLRDLWEALPRAHDADTLLATCSDGYASIYTKAFVVEYRPFVIVEINGQGPQKWPPAGLAFNPGPYVISVSATLAPRLATYLDSSHKRPWGVTTIEVATYADRLGAFQRGAWASLSLAAQAGREIWINSCLSCHDGPNAAFGGTKSGRSFDIVAAQAGNNPDYFRKYVRDPKSVLPDARMEPHPHYTDAQMDALIAFITGK